MTLHLCVLGIDGSGKSTVVAALPALLAGELGVRAGAAGETFLLCDPDDDLLAPGFAPDGEPRSLRLSRRLKRWAKRFVNHRGIYPFFKVGQLLAQDQAAVTIAQRNEPRIMVSDGNTLLSAVGRAANYGASQDEGIVAGKGRDPHGLLAVFAHLLEGKPLPEQSRRSLPALRTARRLQRLLRLLGLRGLWLPDVAFFLDLPPGEALERIVARGGGRDAHENERDMTQAREGYLRALEALALRGGGGTARRIEVGGLSPGEVLEAVAAAARSAVEAQAARGEGGARPLGTTAALTGTSIWGKVLNRRYLVNYLLGKSLQGSWREPLFALSATGRRFLAEGYSAGIMRAIYDRDPAREGFLERAFMEYPLHRAVYDRLQILVPRIEAEVERALGGPEEVRIFTAPSGYAYDVLRALEAVLRRRPGLEGRIRVVASDLDPAGVLGGWLEDAAGRLGVGFEFLRGDLTAAGSRERFAAGGPYDIALFIGLSSWLPKGPLLAHLRWLRAHLREGGRLFTDCFTPAAYAYSGRYVGYRANYYDPAIYRSLLDACGFDGRAAACVSGRDRINHVVVAEPRPGR